MKNLSLKGGIKGLQGIAWMAMVVFVLGASNLTQLVLAANQSSSVTITSGGSQNCVDLNTPITISGYATAVIPPGHLSQYNVAVDWGDNTVSDNVQDGAPGFGDDSESPSTRNFSASHTYSTGGTFTITVTIYHQGKAGKDNFDAKASTVQCIFAGNLNVIKHVINDNGGTAVASDFTLNVTGGNATPSSFAGDENGTPVSVDGNASYSVSETPVSGYTVSYSADCTGTMPSSGQKTCTVTNDDMPATLTVIKQVTNDNGGTKGAGDFTLNVTGGSPSPSSFAGSETGTAVTINAGSYSVSEGTHTGYNVNYSTDCTGTVAPGGQKTCTVTNDDIQPMLTVVKIVDHTNGGSKEASDFPLFVDLGSVINGVANAFGVGLHTVTETGDPDYTPSFSGACDVNGNVTLSIGDDVTCTLTNAYQTPLPGTIKVVKHVINDDGGSKVAGDFTINVDGTSPSDDSFPGDEDGTTVTVTAGAYNITETADAGYQVTYSEDCAGTIAAGQSVTCTVTNDDNDTFSISGTKFDDVNGDHERALEGEGTIPGVDINLYDGETLVDTVTTNADGVYTFNFVAPGSYTVCEVVPEGWQQTYPTTEDGCYGIVVSDANVTGKDFGNQEIPTEFTGSIAGKVFDDTNENGVWDEGEPGLSGWTVYLDDGNDTLDTGEDTATTNPSGDYLFSGLEDGDYTVRIDLPNEWEIIAPAPADDFEHHVTLSSPSISSASSPIFISAVVVSGNTATGLDFALQFTGPGGTFGGSTGGTGNGGGSTPPPATTPGNVLGETTETPSTTPPTPSGGGQVLGEQLPVTGVPVSEFLFAALLGYLVFRLRRSED